MFQSISSCQEKYEKRLKDAAARELMRAEEAAMLDKVENFLYTPLMSNLVFTSQFFSVQTWIGIAQM